MKLPPLQDDDSTPYARTLRRRRKLWLREPNFDDRLNDAVGPVLGRDVQQAMNARITSVVFMLGGILLLQLFLPTGRASLDARNQIPVDDGAILNCWGVLLVLVWCGVPIRAFLRAREDVAEPIVEQLSLCDLSPVAIARDKLLGSLLLALALAGMFAPILAFQSALGAVAVRTSVTAGFVAFVGTVIAVSIALAAAALCRNPLLRSVALAGTTIVVVVPTLALVQNLDEAMRALARHLGESPWALWFDLLVAGALASSVALCVAARAYAHTRDHLDVTLRRLGLVVPLVIAAMGTLVPGSSFALGPPWLPLALVAPFWWWAILDDAGQVGGRYALTAIAIATLASIPLATGRQLDVIAVVSLQSLVFAGLLALACAHPKTAARAAGIATVATVALLALPWFANAASGRSLFESSALDVLQPIAANRQLLRDGVAQHQVSVAVLATLALGFWLYRWRLIARAEAST